MGPFVRFERLVECIVEGLFRRARVAGTHPVEIARHIIRKMEDERRISVSRVYVPNEYIVHLNPGDLARVEPLGYTLSSELSGHVRDRAGRYGYAFIGPVEVRFVGDPDMDVGAIMVDGRFVEGDLEVTDRSSLRTVIAIAGSEVSRLPTGEDISEDTSINPSPGEGAQTQVFSGMSSRGGSGEEGRKPHAARLVVERGDRLGEEFGLTEGVTIIGRRKSSDVVLEDPSTSRDHAEVRYERDGFVLVDCGSTNGTFVNGKRIERHVLQDGDLIRVGKTLFRFRVV
ncbi:MAG: DUF3662 and FHA domain-containing protein [Firmicutes bacterium]|nr:DUF3662 and FHA domain-containing protein [Bacillota bacterium]